MVRKLLLTSARAPLTWAALAGVAAVLTAPSASAQEEGPAQLAEVVVTARKVAENLQDVPVAVTVFSGEDLQRQNAVRVSDVARLAPGLSTRETPATPSALLPRRRAQVQPDTLATLDPSVGPYVDGFYWARSYGLNAGLLDLRSAQVLKGPQGT